MAAKLFSVDEAAAMLGVSPAKLGELRQRGAVHGVRDGAGWKFKQDDIDRYLRDVAAESSSDPTDSSSNLDMSSLIDFDAPKSASGLELPVDIEAERDSVSLSDIDLNFGSGTGSGISGLVAGSGAKPTPAPASGGGSDIELKFGDSGLNLLSGSSIGKGDGPKPGTSGGGSELGIAMSDVKLASTAASGIDLSAGSSNVLGTGSSGSGPDAGKTMLTAEAVDRPGLSSVKMTVRDQESIFGDAGSDVTHNIQGSGINLLDAGDSGLALDSLRLAASTSQLGKKKSGASDLELKGEDDFLLTPLEEQVDESTDSGSQVIALDGDFGDDATATIMAGDVPGLAGALEDAGDLSPLGGAGAMGMSAGMVPSFAPPPEPSYGIVAVLGLSFCSVALTLVGIMMYDILRHMWSWDTPYSFNSSLMDMILKLFG